MKMLRVVIVGALASVFLGIVPAHANDCSNPKQPCGGCHVNWEISTQDPRPVICYPV